MNVLSGITNLYPSEKSYTSSTSPVEGQRDENQSSVVTLSEDALRLSEATAPTKKSMLLNVFGTPQHKIPPQPSSALEDMVYARGGQHIDFTQSPPVWPSDNKALDYNDWLNYEKELDKQTSDRIDIYERSIVAGLSKDEIVAEIKKYNDTLHPRYFHSTSVEKRPNDIERPLYEKPPTGTYLPEVVAQRQNNYEHMVTAMSRSVKDIKKYQV